MNACALATFALGLATGVAHADGLPKLALDASRTTVSGLSSGAYMAHQVHVAYSDHIAGAALIAGGPYHCAQGTLQTALASCMTPAEGKAPDVAALAAFAKDAAKAGRIAPLAGLSGDHVLILHGRADKTVAESLSTDTAALYRALAAGAKKPLDLRKDLAGAYTHTFPTLGAGAACDVATAPFVGHCGYDAAGAIFAALYGRPAHAVAATAAGEPRAFDQEAYRIAGADAHLAAKGYIYVPAACEKGRCALHVAFHGCQQNAETIDEAFVRDAGYNRWADAYGVVVLYPQTRATMAPLNPKGCWDWWGYSGEAYDTRDGAQLRQVAAMAAALGAPLLDGR
ncbi:PHB depolymerase family esterase [Dokdonella sp.]|uniref:extracellular catalytic domain type 2 short-chain-length polyhydroxyalkanoate depolymerase n=1 Tax=Dokdonella sp. TaxID=2291710 RepID=UPI003783BCB8